MKSTSVDDKISKYSGEFNRWLNVLEKYHKFRFDRNYRQYTSLNDTKGTAAKITDPVASEQIEKVIQKMFEREPSFFALARGRNMPKEITDIISIIPEYYWNCPERVMDSGTMRAKLKVAGREFCVVGNLAVEVYYNSSSDTPDLRVVPVEDIIFDPAKTLKTSPVYYFRQFVSLDYLKENIKTKDENGVVKGLFDKSAVDRIVKTHAEKKIKQDPTTNRINRSGSDEFEKNVDEVELVSRWEGSYVCRIADWQEILQEEKDPLGIQDHPFSFAMDIEVPKEPYALSLLDFINGLNHTKDLILNQIVDYGSKSLNPPLFVNPAISPINRVTLRNAYKIGGIVFADPNLAKHQQMPPLPREGFELLGYLQQRAESTSGIGAYLGGVPNQQNDKTKGTATGVKALLEQAQSPVQDRQRNIEESVVEPVVNKWLKMAGNLMAENEIKYILMTGKDKKWVNLTKGILTGKITLTDLIDAELVEPEEAQQIALTLQFQGKDPEKELLFDVDWVLRVETGSMAEVDKAQELENFDSTIQSGIRMGVQLDLKKAWIERAEKAGIKEPEQYISQETPMAPQTGLMAQANAPLQ